MEDNTDGQSQVDQKDQTEPGQQTQENQNTGNEPAPGEGKVEGADSKTYTQADLDKAVGKLNSNFQQRIKDLELKLSQAENDKTKASGDLQSYAKQLEEQNKRLRSESIKTALLSEYGKSGESYMVPLVTKSNLDFNSIEEAKAHFDELKNELSTAINQNVESQIKSKIGDPPPKSQSATSKQPHEMTDEEYAEYRKKTLNLK